MDLPCLGRCSSAALPAEARGLTSSSRNTLCSGMTWAVASIALTSSACSSAMNSKRRENCDEKTRRFFLGQLYARQARDVIDIDRDFCHVLLVSGRTATDALYF